MSGNSLQAEAADWFARLQDPQADAAEQRRWRTWHARSPAHAQAWAEVEAIWGSFERLPRQLPPEFFGKLARQRRQLLRRAGTSVLGLAGAGLLGREVQRQHWGAELRTARAEARGWTLADGSRLWLNAQSAADLDYGAEQRRIRLHRGELLLESQPDPRALPRPLLVDSPLGSLVASLDTRFSLQLLSDGMGLLSAFAGSVQLLQTQQRVAAGQSLRFGPGAPAGAAALGPAELRRESWRQGLLLAERGLRLDEFLRELAPYHRGWLVCDPAVAGLRLIGSFTLRDSRQALAAMAQALPVRLSQPLPGLTRVLPRA